MPMQALVGPRLVTPLPQSMELLSLVSGSHLKLSYVASLFTSLLDMDRSLL